ncbi:MAG TPA: hypothetical protein VK153_00525 [Candidatus Paceibacterota bacterium]|nr:hypothetical protein [Candidatus Paceibacterota bacterium]
MKKTAFFVFFLLFFVAGVALPAYMFSTWEIAYLFCSILLFIAQIIYAVVLLMPSNGLMGYEQEGFSLVVLLRVIAFTAIAVSAFLFISLIINKPIGGGSGIDVLYYFTTWANIGIILLTILFIFIDDDTKFDGRIKRIH